MMKDLDRIHELGFEVSVNWGDFITINMNIVTHDEECGGSTFSNEIPILMYFHSKKSKASYVEMIPYIIDEFNSWYYDYRTHVETYKETGKLVDKEKVIGLGDISRAIQRKIKIDEVIH